MNWYKTAGNQGSGINEANDTIIGFCLPDKIVSAEGKELVELQREMGAVTFHEALAIKEELETFLDSSERWEYGISSGTLFWWGEPSKSVRRRAYEHLAVKGYRVRKENSYTGLIQNTNLPTILPDASSKNWYRKA